MSGWFAKKLTPPAPGGAQGRDLALEGLRGICACLVLYAHMTMPFLRLDPGYAPSPRFWWFNLGTPAVLFFFVLSGYVIGLTNHGGCTGQEARAYLGRRLLRLAPINTAAVLLGWMIVPPIPWKTVAGNLLFLEHFKSYPFGLHIDVMPDDLNLWSLNFEALYYVAFLVVWWLAPRVGSLFCLVAVFAAGAGMIPGDHVVASSYALGALYWFGGLAVAWLTTREETPGNWPSAMLAIVVIWPLAPLQSLLNAAHVPDVVSPYPFPSLQRMDMLPAALWLLLAVSGRGGVWRARLGVFCLTVASAGLVNGWCAANLADTGAMVTYSAALFLAWLLVGWRPDTMPLERLAPIGAISFGIYAVGFPIQYGLFLVTWLPSGTAWSFALRAALLVAITFGLAWILERKLQPILRRRFGPSAAPE